MDSAKLKYISIKESIDAQSVFVFLISGLIVFGLISFFIWIFTGPSSPPQSPMGDSSSTISQHQGNFSNTLNNPNFNCDYSHVVSPTSTDQLMVNTSTYRGLKTFNKPEVFNVKTNMYRYPEAETCCRQYGARVATKRELQHAQNRGANWCNLGWLTSQDAFYPTQPEQVTASSNWPDHLKNGCGNVGINGGFYPAQLKLSANCYGIKPLDIQNINPWNTITKKWSLYS